MALYIFSDAHLGCGSSEDDTRKIEQMEKLLELVRLDGDRLVLLGDLFDFWFEYKHTIPKSFHRILFLLDDLIRSGVKIDYVAGNHDFWMDDFFPVHMGIPLHRDSLDTEYSGRRLHLIHGDGLAPADRGYRFLKKIFRNRFNIWLYKLLPTDWAYSLAMAVSGSSRNYTSKRDHEFAPDYEAYAKEKLGEGFEVVVIGHLHIPTYTTFDNGIYICSGDFINHFSYVKIDDSGARLEFL